jgi:hypothetical protein
MATVYYDFVITCIFCSCFTPAEFDPLAKWVMPEEQELHWTIFRGLVLSAPRTCDTNLNPNQAAHSTPHLITRRFAMLSTRQNVASYLAHRYPERRSAHLDGLVLLAQCVPDK